MIIMQHTNRFKWSVPGVKAMLEIHERGAQCIVTNIFQCTNTLRVLLSTV